RHRLRWSSPRRRNAMPARPLPLLEAALFVDHVEEWLALDVSPSARRGAPRGRVSPFRSAVPSRIAAGRLISDCGRVLAVDDHDHMSGRFAGRAGDYDGLGLTAASVAEL